MEQQRFEEALISALKTTTALFKAQNYNSEMVHVKGQGHDKTEGTSARAEPVSLPVTLPGTSSPSSPPFPISILKGEGCKLYDLDGHSYYDFANDRGGAGLYGHSDPAIANAIKKAIDHYGLNLGDDDAAIHPLEARFASLLCERFKLEQVRLASSGAEANLRCFRAARLFTGREKIVVFQGTAHHPHHHHQDSYVVLKFNDAKALRTAFKQYPDEIAAVVCEPLQGVDGGGAIPVAPEFVKAIRECTQEAGALWISDEIFASRLGRAGAQDTPLLQGLKPDMITLGGHIGGGMPCGAFGGPSAVMSKYIPADHRSQIISSSSPKPSPLVLCAGIMGLTHVYTPQEARRLNVQGTQLRDWLQCVLRGTRIHVTGFGSIMHLHFVARKIDYKKVRCLDDISAAARKGKDKDNDYSSPQEEEELSLLLGLLFWMEMLEAGFWLPRKGGPIMLSLPMTAEVWSRFVEAVETFCKRHAALVKLPKRKLPKI